MPQLAKNKQINKHKERSRLSSFRFSFRGLSWWSSGQDSALQMPGGGRPGSILDQGTRSPHAAAKAPAYHNEDSVQSKKKKKIQSYNTRRRANHTQSKKKGNIKITAEIRDTEKRKAIANKSQNWFFKMLTKLQILS